MHVRDETKSISDDWGLTRLYILQQAAKGPVFSSRVREELKRHGVCSARVSVARILRGMQGKGYLASAAGSDSHPLKTYVATRRGQFAIEQTKDRLRALCADLSTANGVQRRSGGLRKVAGS